MSLLHFIGVNNAFAEATQTASDAQAATSSSGNLLHMLPMLLLFVAVFYFLLVRPQTKRAKEQKKLLSGINAGDEIMSTGGIVGRVVRLKENYIVMEIAKGVEVTLQKNAIATVLPKGTMDSVE